MNGRRDIERTLDLWLVDGPSVMPDRLFEAVLDRVERTPQRPFARLTLRLTDMNPRIRLYTLAAAGLIVAVVGLYLFNRTSPPVNVGTSPSPQLTPSPSPRTQLPAVLEGIWLGAPRPLDGLDEDAGRTIRFQSNGDFVVTASANDASTRVRSGAVAVGPDRIELTTKPADIDCEEGDVGTYTWSLSPDGQTLTLGADGADTCPVRTATITGGWELSDCPTAEDNCLGTIAAGTHASHFFDQEIGPGDPWTPRYGALTYAVPDGWVNVADWPDSYSLAPAGADSDTSIFFARDIVLSSRTDLCSGSQDAEAGTSAEAISTGLTAPGLDATAPEPVTIGGLPGFRVDVSLGASATACPYSEGVPHQELFADHAAGEGFSWGIQGEARQRLYLLEVEPDRAILVVVQAPDEAAFQAFIGAATSVVESLDFDP